MSESKVAVAEWEKVSEWTMRLAVPGGWIYEVSCPQGDNRVTSSVCFVPTPARGGGR